MAILNESRGHEATGLFNNRGAWIKNNERSTSVIKGEDFTKFIDVSCQTTWALCGHTRASTRGNNTVANAHPFKYGKPGEEVIGSHNGSLDAPNKYSVDTMYAIDLLSQAAPGDYKGALGNVSGWYVLTWVDMRDGAVYLLNWTGSLSFCNHGNCIYYSSEAAHLATAIGPVATRVTKSGDVWRFDGRKFQHMANFKGQNRYQGQQGRGVNCGFQQNHTHYKKPEWPGSDSTNIHGFTGEIQKWDDGIWWGCTRKLNEKGEVFWLKLGNQASFNRLYQDVRLAQSKYPGVNFILSEEQVEEMQKKAAEKADKPKGTLIIEDRKTPPLLASVVDESLKSVVDNVSMPSDAEQEELVRIAEEINEFKQRYGTDLALDARIGPDTVQRDAELETVQEKWFQELRELNYSAEQAVAFLRGKEVFQLGAKAPA